MTLFVELKLVTRTKKTASLRKLDVMSISSKATSNFPAISRYMLEVRSLRRLSQPTLVILKSPSYTLVTVKEKVDTHEGQTQIMQTVFSV